MMGTVTIINPRPYNLQSVPEARLDIDGSLYESMIERFGKE